MRALLLVPPGSSAITPGPGASRWMCERWSAKAVLAPSVALSPAGGVPKIAPAAQASFSPERAPVGAALAPPRESAAGALGFRHGLLLRVSPTERRYSRLPAAVNPQSQTACRRNTTSQGRGRRRGGPLLLAIRLGTLGWRALHASRRCCLSVQAPPCQGGCDPVCWSGVRAPGSAPPNLGCLVSASGGALSPVGRPLWAEREALDRRRAGAMDGRCARAPGLISVRDLPVRQAGDMMVDGVIPQVDGGAAARSF
jgi:hypothetical protein